MKNLSSKIRIMIFASLLFFGAMTTANAQTDNPILKACEETADKAKRLEIENESLKAQLSIAKERLTLKDEQISNKEEQVQFYKKASEKGNEIDSTANLMVLNLRQQVADDRIRIRDLEEENKSLRRSRDFRTVVSFGAGFATGYFTKK